MTAVEQVRQSIIEQLSQVIDPETGVDVLRMHLVEDLTVGEDGQVSYTFRPSSYFCPLAVSLSLDILRAISGVAGVARQKVAVRGYLQADELEKLLDEFQEANAGGG